MPDRKRKANAALPTMALNVQKKLDHNDHHHGHDDPAEYGPDDVVGQAKCDRSQKQSGSQPEQTPGLAATCLSHRILPYCLSEQSVRRLGPVGGGAGLLEELGIENRELHLQLRVPIG